jgi:AraC-like DNA-binding protein
LLLISQSDERRVIRVIACVSGTTLDRWLQHNLPPSISLDLVRAEQLSGLLVEQPYLGAFLALGRDLLKIWPEVRGALIRSRMPTILLAPLRTDVFRILCLERELRVLELHIIGVDDHPSHLSRSLAQLLTEGTLQRFLSHFGSHAAQLLGLISPVWGLLGEVRSVAQWADRLGMEPEALVRVLRAHGVRNSRRLLIWLRLLDAWPRLQAGQSVGRVAIAVGYSATPAFTRCTYRVVGVHPSSAPALSIDQLIARAAAEMAA